MDNSDNNRFDELALSWDNEPVRVKIASEVSGAIKSSLNLNNSMEAMDFGCGTGLISLSMIPELKSVLAIDSSEKMIEVLGKKIAENNIQNITTRFVEISDESYSESSFDLIFSSMVMHHIKDVKLQIETFYKQLKPGGSIALADLDKEDGSFHGDMPGIEHKGFDRNIFSSYLESAGFINIKNHTAHTVVRKDKETGKEKEFPIFLFTAQKP